MTMALTSGDLAHPALAELVTGEAALAYLQQRGIQVTRAIPEYIRHKPGDTTIISYAFEATTGGTERGYVRWCVEPSRADEIMAKALTMRPGASSIAAGVVRLDPQAVFYSFPNDARLRRLRWYTTPRKLKRSLASIVDDGDRISGSGSATHVMRYKPERRVVVRAALATAEGRSSAVFLRYAAARNARFLGTVARRLRRSGVAVPRHIAQLEDGHVAVDDYVPGVDLAVAIRASENLDGELAAALLAFHRTPPPLGVVVRTMDDELRKACIGLDQLARLSPRLRMPATWVSAALVGSQPQEDGRRVLVHGDLHGNNVLVSAGSVCFVDLERVALAHPAADLGRFNAHALSLGIRQPGWSPGAADQAMRTIDAYRSLAQPVSSEALGWHTAVALVDHAILAARHLEANWLATAPALLTEALTQISLSSSRERQLL